MNRAAFSLVALFLSTATAGTALAAGAHSMDDASGEPMLFWSAGADVDGSDAAWLDNGSGTLVTWDAFAWYGGDDVKLRLEAEGDALSGNVGSSELRAMLSWNASDFWDVQAGLQQDLAPDQVTWAFVGVQGLAPYFFDTEARLFVSDNADAAIRLRQSFDILFTQSLILEPHADVIAYAQDVLSLGVGAGLSHVEAGLQLRYEITRDIAPYIDLVTERDLGETSIITRRSGEDPSQSTLRVGLRIRL
jgi:copper resistance protein B